FRTFNAHGSLSVGFFRSIFGLLLFRAVMFFRMRNALSLILIVGIVIAYRASLGSAATASDYRRSADAFLDGYFAWRPIEGVEKGLHEYDGRAPDFSAASVKDEHARLIQSRERFRSIDAASLSPAEDIE